MYREVMYTRGLRALFQLSGAASIQVRLYLRANYMQSPESEKPVKAVWHT